MALTKQKKQEIVKDAVTLLSNSKMTVVAAYPGTTVQAMQLLRRQSKASSTEVRVIKNRLVKKAIEQTDNLKNVDTSSLTGQLLYAFNAEDEAAPAQALANFAKLNPTLEFICAITNDGQLLDSDSVKVLASLPSKDVLRGQLVGTLAAPLSGFVNVVSGNIRGLLYVLQSRTEKLNASS